MRLGMIVRADNRGLGNLTREMHRHLQPAKTLVVEMHPEGFTPYAEHLDRFPGARSAIYSNGLPTEALEWLLADVDVLYTAETPYDHRLFEMARDRGVRTVLHGMFEFLRWTTEASLPRPDLFLAPSTWRLDEWPEPTVYLPVPVARDRLPFAHRTEAHTFLHVAGHPAAGDRNGTRILLQAVPYLRSDARLIVRTQAPLSWRQSRFSGRVQIEEADVTDYWRLYDGADVLVAPRRYGGLSLPMQEAASLGMPVITTDMAPQSTLFSRRALVDVRRTQEFRAPAATLRRAEVDPRRLAAKIDELAGDPALVSELSAANDVLAASLSWEALGPLYRKVLAEA